MNFLTVAGIFKNESHVIKEWIQHYLNEGADHFLLIDNGSTDDYKNQIKEFISEGLITIIYDDSKWAQVELYNKYFTELKNQCQWVLVCDLDEFVYSRRGYETIETFLHDLPSKVGAVRIPWKMFGSSDYIKQPDYIIQKFITRASYNNSKKPWMAEEKMVQSKVIVKPQKVIKYFVHHCDLHKCKVIGADKKKLKYKKLHQANPFQPVNEKILENSYLHLNHYPLQSKEWFLNVKCQRGAADTEKHENVRNLNYFEEYNIACSDIIDKELAHKKY
ncbi:Glycosyl transferase family 2 [Ekhidna lutea]|uniref:Glycosyl transferase family 2 n=1 Tax=Ekhidna lutea TaxID=447679 RepID=A0A239FPM0_EKHLU|nr:glycosyltransferase family 2 protein [Ekhidna lutea]SNS58867.1 Glycosyl transferase family 2 [Ekhidna lutea]